MDHQCYHTDNTATASDITADNGDLFVLQEIISYHKNDKTNNRYSRVD